MTADEVKVMTFLGAMDADASLSFPFSVKTEITINVIEMEKDLLKITEKSTTVFICLLDENSNFRQDLGSQEVLTCKIEGKNESEITDIGKEYLKTTFQIEEYSSVFPKLLKRIQELRLGLRFWNESKVWSSIAEIQYIFRVIDVDLARMKQYIKIPDQKALTHGISTIAAKLVEGKNRLELQKGQIKAQGYNINLFFFIFGLIFGVIMSLLIPSIV